MGEKMGYKKIDTKDIEKLIEITSKERVFFGNNIIDDYSHDEMPIYGKFMPELMIEAKNTEEIEKIMRYASMNNIPVTPRGAGTGLCGGAVAICGGIIISTTKMNKILELDEDNLAIVIEPGVLLADLKSYLLDKELMYPPDPGEKGATIAGNVMTNAGGMRAVKYGVTRDYVRGMELVLSSGDKIELGGKAVKNSSGYSLKDLIIGSEGTLGIITKLILRLIPKPGHTASLLIPYNDIDSCIASVPKILKYRSIPTAIEFMEKEVIETAEGFTGKKFPHNSAEAYLLILFDANSSEELEKSYMDIAQICLENGAEDVFIADTDKNMEAIWSLRDVFLEAIKNSTTEMDECDVVVPVNRLADFVNSIKVITKRHELRILTFGHAGDGNVHVYICKDDVSDDIWKRKLELVMKELYNTSQKLGIIK